MKEKIIFSYEDDELDYEDEYINNEENDDLEEGYYQGYDDDDYQNPDSDYEDE